jgi:hypothetical protein
VHCDVIRCSVTCLFVCKRECGYIDRVLLASVFALYMRPAKSTHE